MIVFVLPFLILAFVDPISSQKLLVVIVEGVGGSQYHKFAKLDGFRVFENEGVWSDQLYPEFPTLSLPNRYSLLTGKEPILGLCVHLDH